MSLLAIKEFVSIFQFIIALLSILAMIFLCLLFPLLVDKWVFALQCMLCSVAIICVIFGLSTWFYNSNISKTRLQVRIYRVVILWLMLGLLCPAAIMCAINLLNSKLYDLFDIDSVFGRAQKTLLIVAMALALVATGLLLVITIVQTMLAIFKAMRHSKRRKSSQRSSNTSLA